MSAEPKAIFPAPLTTYGPLALRFFNNVAARRVPLGGNFELTHRCNLACVHCYVNLPAHDRPAQRRELTYAQICRILDELAELGTLNLTLSGGEPLVRGDFVDIYRYAHKKGFLLTVYTNATLITDKVLAAFADCPPTIVDITQYGYTAATYDAVAAAGEGQYARFWRGFSRLRQAGVAVSLKTIAMRANAHEVAAIAEFARQEGIDYRMDPVISARIDGGKGPLLQRLTPMEIAALEAADQPRQAAMQEYCSQYLGHVPASDDLYQCGAGLGNFLIDPYGRLHVCELSRTLGWDIVEHGFAKGWYEAIPQKRAQKRSHTTGCGSCTAHGGCSICTGMAELEGQDPADGSDYFCHLTDARNQFMFGAERPQPQGLVKLRLPSGAARL